VRDIKTGEPVPYDRSIGKYVIPVEPHKAVLELDYFIERIEQAERKRDEEI
jgi:hypothetical protein